ncbi:Protein NLRC5 [Exaiptasia diaphana]|nr:Protein NLRC5 [Exaiptasia diaphana]
MRSPLDFSQNYCCLVLLLNRVGLVKLRKLFIDEWNSLGGFVPWTDSHQNGVDLLTKYIPRPAYEIPKVQSGDTTKWDISLFVKVLLNSRPPFVDMTNRALVDGLRYLKETRNKLCHSGSGRITPAEFTPLYNDVSNVLLLVGASPQEIQKVEDDVLKLEWNELLLLVKECSDQDKDILQGIDIIKKRVNEIWQSQQQSQKAQKKLLEGQSSLKREVDVLNQGHAGLQQGVETLHQGQAGLQQGVETLNQGQAGLQQGVETLNQGQAGLQQGVETLNQGQAGLQQGVETLNQGQAGLQQGVETLNQGQAGLQQGVETLNQGQAGLQQGVETLNQGQAGLQQGVETLNQGQAGLQQGVETLNQGQAGLQQGVETLNQGQAGLQQGVETLNQGQAGLQQGVETLNQGQAGLQQGVETLNQGQAGLQQGVETLNQGQAGLQQGVETLNQGQAGLQQGVETLNQGQAGLQQGVETLNQGQAGLQQGVETLNQGQAGLQQGVETLNQGQAGLQQGVETLNQGQAGLQQGVETLNQADLESYLVKLKESILQQTDFLPKGIDQNTVKTDDIFTNLTLHHEEKEILHRQTGQKVDQVARKMVTKLTQCCEIFIDENKENNPKSILISGEPGIGKTLFSQKIVRDWSTNSLLIPDIYFTYFITFKQLARLGNKELTLRELLNHSLLLNEKTMVTEDIMAHIIQHPEQLFIVFDGFDEYKDRDKIIRDFEEEFPNDVKAKMPVDALVSKLIRKKILRDSVSMITSRPSEAGALDQKIHFHRYVEITGFSKIQVIDYVEKYFKCKPEKVRKMAVNKVKGSPHHISFGRAPFRCFLMCIFIEWEIKNKRDNLVPATLTEFYCNVIKCIETNYNKAILKLDEKAASLAVDQTLDNFARLAAQPSEAGALDQKIHFHRYVEITGFSKIQVIDYVEKYFKCKPEKVRKMAVNKVKGSPHHISFGRAPFRCFLMCIFIEWEIKNKRDNLIPATLTEFYCNVIKCIETNYNKAILKLDEKAASLAVDQTLDNFARLAAQLVEQNRFSFTSEDLENLNSTEKELLLSSNLIICYPVSSNLPFQKPTCEYSFTHFTIQEFFVALYLVKKGVMAAQESTEMVYIFMSGLLGLDNNKKSMVELLECLGKHIEDEDRLRLVSLRCLHEFQDKSLSKQEVTRNPDYRYWNSNGRIGLQGVTDTDCAAIAMLVESTATSISSPPHRLDINISFITSVGLSSLMPSIIHYCSITVLWLLYCYLYDECAECLGKYLPNTNLTQLDLYANKITDVGVRHIINNLPSNLTYLDLAEQLFIVFDGFDEYKDRDKIIGDFEEEFPNDVKAKMSVEALVSKLIRKKILRDSVSMITSRPSEAGALDQKIHFHRYVEITGFSKIQVIDYVEKYFKCKPEKVRKMAVNKVKGSPHHISFGRAPFRCFLMCIFIEWEIKNKRDNLIPATLTEFYCNVIKCIETNYNKAILELDEKAASLAVDQTLDNFARLAAQLVEQNRFSFTSEDLENLNSTEKELLLSSNLIICYPVSSNLPFQKPTCEYSFTHFTIQEFFVALYLVKKGVMAAQESTEMVYIFMSGLLGLDNNKKSMVELLECLGKDITSGKYEFRLRLVSLRCLHEFQDKGLSKQEVTRNPDHRYWDSDRRIVLDGVTDKDCAVIAMLVEYTATSISSPPRTLSIINSFITSVGLSSLMPSIIHNCSITVLWLSFCDLYDECAECLGEYLPNTNLTRLYLDNNNITDVGVRHIINNLPSNLTYLALFSNPVSNECKKWAEQFCNDNHPGLLLRI